MSGIKKVKIGENVAGIKVHGSAYDAANRTNEMTTVEDFTAKPVGLFDTESGQWLDVSEEDLSNPEVINNYKAEGGRLAVAL